jgi:hypothetical protein
MDIGNQHPEVRLTFTQFMDYKKKIDKFMINATEQEWLHYEDNAMDGEFDNCFDEILEMRFEPCQYKRHITYIRINNTYFNIFNEFLKFHNLIIHP